MCMYESMQFKYTVCISNCSLDENEIGSDGGVALGGALTANVMLETLRYAVVVSLS